jgi:small conductance mechanosensitive channel
MPEFWQRVLVAAAMILIASAAAKLVDWRISRHELAPEAATRYRVVRRSVFALIVFVGVMSALLVIPQVRAIAGGVLASSAVIGIVIGFASQRTIGNLVAGVLIAFSQPLRLGDEVEVQGTRGIVEEIGLTYTWIRTRENERFVVPNERLAAETIRNSTIRSGETRAEARVSVPLQGDVRGMLQSLRMDGVEAYLDDLGAERATIVLRRWVPHGQSLEEAASELRLTAAERLGLVGVVAP